MALKLKLDAAGHVVVQDGKPVYIDDKDNKEIAFDADHSVSTIARLNGEARGHREAKEAAEAKLKPFEKITDPAAALKALDTVKNLDDKKLVDAGEVERVKSEAIRAVEEKYAPTVSKVKELESQLYGEKIGGAFARSPLLVGEKAIVNIPADLVQARFGTHFTIKDGKVVATDAHGNQIYSRTKPGELADFDEALETLINAYPQKDSILKGAGGSGSGASTSGGGSGGQKSMSRATFEQLSPEARAAEVKGGTLIT
jgi:hypothetical protein